MVEEMNQEMTNDKVLKSGDIIRGKVVKIEEKNALVDVGYKFDGILPIGEVSNLHIENISDALNLGDEFEFKVIKINDEEEKLILSKKTIDSEKAWGFLTEKLNANEIFEVKIADAIKGGLVADVGVRAFIPASLVEKQFVEEFSGYIGKTLKVKIVELDKDKNKVILSHRIVVDEEEQKAKQDAIEQIKVGDIKEGTVQRLTGFGAFVDIGGIDGLIHVSEIAWTRVDNPADVLKLGDKINVKVIRIDPVNKRISLSIKETKESPIEKALSEVKVGEIYTGAVKRLTGFGAFVELLPGVEGLVHISQIAHQHISKPSEVLSTGQQVKVKVLEVDAKAGRISLSIREAEDQVNYEEEKQKYMDTNEGFNLTIGDLFGEKLKKLK